MSNDTPKLYIVATPIGNLEDITLRAIRILGEVDEIYAEDTRVTKKLLNHYKIETPVRRYDENVHEIVSKEITEKLRGGESIALVTDAGTPGVSDPGWRLVSELEDLRKGGIFTIVPIPGPSSVIAALSIAGVDASNFTFLGFIPTKKGRETFFKDLELYTHPVVVFESPNRLLKTLEKLSEMYPEKNIQVYRELTKIFESKMTGPASELLKHYTDHPDTVKGECVLIIEPTK